MLAFFAFTIGINASLKLMSIWPVLASFLVLILYEIGVYRLTSLIPVDSQRTMAFKKRLMLFGSLCIIAVGIFKYV